jgi:hypothetical protein
MAQPPEPASLPASAPASAPGSAPADPLIRSASTFLAGMLTGAILVYYLPPATTGGSAAGNGDPGQEIPGVIPGMVPGMVPGMQPGMVPGMVPGMQPGMQPGTPPDTTGDSSADPASTLNKPPLPTATEGRLAGHLRNAPGLWGAALYQAQNAQLEKTRAVAPEIEAHIRTIPPQGSTLSQAEPYFMASRLLFQKMRAAGLDATELSLQIDAVLRPPDALQ